MSELPKPVYDRRYQPLRVLEYDETADRAEWGSKRPPDVMCNSLKMYPPAQVFVGSSGLIMRFTGEYNSDTSIFPLGERLYRYTGERYHE